MEIPSRRLHVLIELELVVTRTEKALICACKDWGRCRFLTNCRAPKFLFIRLRRGFDPKKMRPNVMMYEPERMRRLVLLNQTQLYFMIQNLDWEGFRRRARSHPQELDVQDEGTGNTLLHEACRRDPPPDVIQTLQAVSRVKNHQGATPLHIAASHRCSAQALTVLLECAETLHVRADSNAEEASDQNKAPAPNTSTTNTTTSPGRSPTTDLSNMGRAPIHYACMSFRGLEIDAFLVLLDATLRHGNLTLDQQDDSLLPDDEDEFDEEIDIEYLLPPQQVGAGKDAPRVVNVMSMKDATVSGC